MQVRRREFLGFVAAAALIHGLDRIALGGDDAKEKPPEAPPAWFTDALAEMKATKSPGVAIVLPADKEARAALLAELQLLLQHPPFDAQVHLVEAVYVVVAGVHAGAKEGETLVLLDADGKRVAGSTTTLTARDFAKIVRPLLRADDRLATRAKAARTPDVEKLLEAIAGKDVEKANDAIARLLANFAAAGPAVLAAYEATKEGEANGRLAGVIVAVFVSRRGYEGSPDARPLPFGTKWKAATTPEPEPDPCPACGMMAFPARSRDTLEFLAKDSAEKK